MDGELLSRYDRGEECWCCSQKKRDRLFLRDIDINIAGSEEEITFQRLTILPNVEGQKYTLGKVFTCRKEQGEFIFLTKSFSAAVKGKPGCEINVEGNKFFVSSIARRPGVFINDVKVLKKTELKFGDNLSFGDERAFLFKERELDPDAFTESSATELREERMEKARHAARFKRPRFVRPRNGVTLENGLEFTPGQNGLVLSHILSYLPIDELKTGRFVSKLWNEECFKILRKRCTVSFNYERGYEDTNESMQLFRYSVEMEHCPMPNWMIYIPGIGATTVDEDDEIDPAPGKPGFKLLDDLNSLIFDKTEKFKYVKRLELDGFIYSTVDYELRLNLLQALGKHLEELTWSGCWYLDKASGKDYTFPENTRFSKLRVFTLNVQEGDISVYGDFRVATDCSSHNWMRQMIIYIQSVTTLRLDCPASFSLAFLSLLHENKSKVDFPNLQHLKILHINPDVIKILLKLKFNAPLVKLELFGLEDMKKDDFSAFGQLLAKHAATLESLVFIIPRIPMNEPGSVVYPPVLIDFPSFPNLEYLNIGWDPEAKPRTTNIKLAFSNGNEIINYERDLPCLKSLTLWPLGHGKYPEKIERSVAGNMDPCIYEVFFPSIVGKNPGEDLEISKTLQRLDILHQVVTFNGVRIQLFPQYSATIISGMFPNVTNNEWINSIRDGSAYPIKEEKQEESPNSSPEKKPQPKKRKKKEIVVGRLRSETRNQRVLRPRAGGANGNVITPNSLVSFGA